MNAAVGVGFGADPRVDPRGGCNVATAGVGMERGVTIGECMPCSAGIGCKGAAEECDSDGIGTCVETGSASETGAIVETAVGTDTGGGTTEVLTVHVTGDGM